MLVAAFWIIGVTTSSPSVLAFVFCASLNTLVPSGEFKLYSKLTSDLALTPLLAMTAVLEAIARLWDAAIAAMPAPGIIAAMGVAALSVLSAPKPPALFLWDSPDTS